MGGKDNVGSELDEAEQANKGKRCHKISVISSGNGNEITVIISMN